MDKDIEQLKYPVGRFKKPTTIDDDQIADWIKIIENFPTDLKQVIEPLTGPELVKKYRPQGWTIIQVIHHCADSHMNSFIRFKLALTEDTPAIKPYFEDLWAELADASDFSVESSIGLIEGLHARWTHLLRSLSGADFKKQFRHPETDQLISLETNIGLYAWHCQHHLAHIKLAIEHG